MKKFLLLAGLVFVMSNLKSQVIDTTVTFISACQIQPVKVKITDTTYSTKIGVKSLADNLQNSATLYGCFLDKYNRITNEFNYNLTGSEYANFDGSTKYLFNLFAQKYSLVFINQ
jgi:hypothetical protein